MTTQANMQPRNGTADTERPEADLPEGSNSGDRGGSERASTAQAASAPQQSKGPGLSAPPAAGTGSIPPSPASASPQPPAARASLPPEGDPLELVTAERFAAEFRPSWAPDDPPDPRSSAQSSSAPSAAAPSTHTSRPADVSLGEHIDTLEMPKVVLRKERGRAFAILAACLVGVVGLMYLAITSSSLRKGTDPLPSAEARKEAPAREPDPPAAAPEIAAAAAPSAALAPTHVPIEAAEPGASGEPTEPSAAAEPSATDLVPSDPNDPQPADPSSAAAPSEATAATAAAEQIAIVEAGEAEEATAAKPEPEPEPEPAAAATSVTPPQPSAAAAAAPDKRAAAERPKQVLLDIAAYPPNTQLWLDGTAIKNPLRVRLPRMSRHRIDARAPGYMAEVHQLRLEADAQLMIKLKRDPRIAAAQAKRAAAAARPSANAPRKAAASAPRPARPASTEAPAKARGAGFVSDNPY